MMRSVWWLVGSLALLANAAAHADVRQAQNRVILDTDGNVRTFYGVPVKLTRSGLKRLHFRVTKKIERYEDSPVAVYTIAAQEGVLIEATFERDGRLYGADTDSPNARGPKGLGIGSTLAELKAAWPKGVLLFGFEDGYFVTFVSGTNVLFRFNPADMPKGAFDHNRPRDFPVPDTIRVQSMSVYSKPNPIPKPYDPGDYDFSESSFTGEVLKNVPVQVDVVRVKRSALRRISARLGGKALAGFVFDPSNYPDFDPYSIKVRFASGTLYLEFRYGPYKDCNTKEDDRNSLYVFFGRDRTTISSSIGKFGDKHIANGSLITRRRDAETPVATVHGCPVPNAK